MFWFDILFGLTDYHNIASIFRIYVFFSLNYTLSIIYVLANTYIPTPSAVDEDQAIEGSRRQ